MVDKETQTDGPNTRIGGSSCTDAHTERKPPSLLSSPESSRTISPLLFFLFNTQTKKRKIETRGAAAPCFDRITAVSVSPSSFWLVAVCGSLSRSSKHTHTHKLHCTQPDDDGGNSSHQTRAFYDSSLLPRTNERSKKRNEENHDPPVCLHIYALCHHHENRHSPPSSPTVSLSPPPQERKKIK